MLKTFTKWFSGLLICLIVAIIGYFLWFKHGVNFIYGAHTKVVDHSIFATSVKYTVIKDVNILSPDGQSMLPNRTVVLDEQKILSVTAEGETIGRSIPSSATVINGRGKYMIPGLVDSHAHLLKSPNDLLLYVANGVTHIRDLGGPPERLELREEIEQGRIGPKMFVASPPIDSMGRLEGAFWEIITFHKNTISVEHAKSRVREFAEQGYDAIKIYHLDMPSYRAVNEVAAELGLPTTGHFPLTMELSELAITQQKEVAHIEEIIRVLIREFGSINERGSAEFFAHVEARSDAIIDDLLANEISVNTVLWFMESVTEQYNDLETALKVIPIEYANPGIVEGTQDSDEFKVGWLPGYNQFEPEHGASEEERKKSLIFWQARGKAHHILLKAMARRGVTLLAGTDSGGNLVVPGFSMHDELSSLQSAGLSNAQALAAATINPAKLMGSNAGAIDTGKRADLLLLNKNPLINIKHTQEIDTVILNGRVLDRDKLDAMLAAVKQANEKSRKLNIDRYL
ncbi:amidohydrolase family protein [Pleionea mediterranea]|uniref:Imidazolonepropionase-like amidohydrolase n=1 Tax=Pleionea mediterranea TaxID=523701 RepID=A0A316FTA1_9GAMM|nr:amidohydrolase family protein [Pleionea mediterranea]PWK50936.1 imidazolonepropionase-like amidohydrolase [Pleionea mediterranea]